MLLPARFLPDTGHFTDRFRSPSMLICTASLCRVAIALGHFAVAVAAVALKQSSRLRSPFRLVEKAGLV